MKRRTVLLGGAGLAGAAALAGLGAMTFRLHATPRRAPDLTAAHLATLRDLPRAPGPRVLFVGNSMTLRHDLAARIGARAQAEGAAPQIAVAAARGARLIETQRIAAFRAVLESGWDILVLQDFSTVSLRAPDRWGSAFAMQAMAKVAQPRAVVLFPTWAFPPRHRVYSRGAGALSRPPADPGTFAQAIIAHYEGVARSHGWHRAPVTEAFLPDATPWLEEDLHHPNPAGTARLADVLWQSLARTLA
ncbi:SGNH/GDSL hydrolase family protein [uncultured Roseobacter sp.]|uniref:SGNH/GDSL hydrolase family protein n=1 Tax=uncultured Roseobacter sp. TaxID=114847 RepID=UPI002629F9DB|nr:SGNH/GDSL hydrolase family protein [uncultured Roseobacter sp.]